MCSFLDDQVDLPQCVWGRALSGNGGSHPRALAVCVFSMDRYICQTLPEWSLFHVTPVIAAGGYVAKLIFHQSEGKKKHFFGT